MSLKLIIILVVGTLFHIWALWLNEVLKVADSFAYLQMSHFLKELSPQWLGSWWFGFLYSLPIWIIDTVVGDDFLSAKIVNIFLFNISAVLLYKIARNILTENWSYFVIVLFFLSPTLLHFNIHILSENIYIPLFLFLVLQLFSYIKSPNVHKTITIAIIIWCMYLTRAEAFIYILSIFWIALWLLKIDKLSFWKFIKHGCLFLLSFFLFISPYLYHLHTLTWEWWLTNKWASNLRQAELRGTIKLDDSGFEQAVAELTDDKHHLIAGFAWGMKYDTPQIEWSLISYITKDASVFMQRFLTNQKKLITRNIPEIFLGKSPGLYLSNDSRFGGNIIFLIFSIFPLFVLLYWVVILFRKERDWFYIIFYFFLPASIFFTIFFTLNRYFLIFLPLLFIVFTYALQELQKQKKYIWNPLISVLLIANILGVLLLSNSVYINTEKGKDAHYLLKKDAGQWINTTYENTENLKIMERFPIVTYYSGAKNRWITPYERETENIIKYAQYNDVDMLVVDTMDFLTYRPFLEEYLNATPNGMTKLIQFTNTKDQKVILYEFK